PLLGRPEGARADGRDGRDQGGRLRRDVLKPALLPIGDPPARRAPRRPERPLPDRRRLEPFAHPPTVAAAARQTTRSPPPPGRSGVGRTGPGLGPPLPSRCPLPGPVGTASAAAGSRRPGLPRSSPARPA